MIPHAPGVVCIVGHTRHRHPANGYIVTLVKQEVPANTNPKELARHAVWWQISPHVPTFGGDWNYAPQDYLHPIAPPKGTRLSFADWAAKQRQWHKLVVYAQNYGVSPEQIADILKEHGRNDH